MVLRCQATRMNQTTDVLCSTQIAGLSCRTNHERAMQDIAALWEEVRAAGLLAHCTEAWALYHDYQLTSGGYEVTVTVGASVMANSKQSGSVLTVPPQSCVRLSTDGSIAQVADAWQKVWTMWPDGGPRTFVMDAERWILGPNGTPTSADIFVGVRTSER